MSITDAENVTTKIPYINEELQYHHTVAYKCRSFQKTFHEKKKKKKSNLFIPILIFLVSRR